MKKVLCLLLVAVLCVSFAACGGQSKEKMTEQAVKLDRAELLETMTANAERAKNEYNGKVVLLENVPVYFQLGGRSLETSYRISLKPAGFTTMTIRFELPKEEMLTVNDGDHISVIGILEVKGEFDVVLKNAFLAE